MSTHRAERIVLEIGAHKVHADVADTPELRAKGLMNRLVLEEDTGMIFVFEDLKTRSFWMKETYLPLSIAYLDDKGVIINIEKMTPLDITGIKSSNPARYALEMNEGWFEKRGIIPGDVIHFPKSLTKKSRVTMKESKVRSLIRRILRENFVSHSDEPSVGDRIVNNNTKCKHYGSEGVVLSIDSLEGDAGKTVKYWRTNGGENWEIGDVLEKTMDQLTRMNEDASPKEDTVSEGTLRRIIRETIILDLKKGDVILTGKFKNKRTVVKEIGVDSNGHPTVNGKSILKFKVEKFLPRDEWSAKSKKEKGK